MRPKGNQGRCNQCLNWHELRGDFCPVMTKVHSMFRSEQRLKSEHYFGESPAPFIGRYGYPHVNVGILGVPDTKDTYNYDAPKIWSSKDYKIPQIVDFRSSMINSREKADIKDNTKIVQLSQEVALSSSPVDIEVKLKKKPNFTIKLDAHSIPMGPSAVIEHAKTTSSAKIPGKVDKIVSDADMKASEGLMYLYNHDFDENYLSKILSVGTLGIEKNRKLVPTRWSITATDDTIGKNLIDEIRYFNEIDTYKSFFGSYLGNYYLALFIPGKWSYELFEISCPKGDYSTDYENYFGRKTYAENTVGGYYAARLAILERLKEMKKQASILLLRFVTNEYSIPLGVWVCREASRKSINSKPIEFASKELMLKYAEIVADKKFGIKLENILKKSLLLIEMKNQKRLWEF